MRSSEGGGWKSAKLVTRWLPTLPHVQIERRGAKDNTFPRLQQTPFSFSMYYTFTLLQPSHVLHGAVQSDPQRRFFPYQVLH